MPKLVALNLAQNDLDGESARMLKEYIRSDRASITELNLAQVLSVAEIEAHRVTGCGVQKA
jgi:hypothetical protein